MFDKFMSLIRDFGTAILGGGVVIGSVVALGSVYYDHHLSERVRLKVSQQVYLQQIEALNSEFQELFARLALENEHPLDRELVEQLLSNLRHQNQIVQSLESSLPLERESVVGEYRESLRQARKTISESDDPGQVQNMWTSVVAVLIKKKDQLTNEILEPAV